MNDLTHQTPRTGAGEPSSSGVLYVVTGNGEGQSRQWEVRWEQGSGLAGAWAGLLEEAVDGNTEWVLLWDAQLGPPPFHRLEALVGGRGEVYHAGLGLGLAGLPRLLSLIRPTWMLGADADPAIESSSWRLSPRACFLRAEVIRQLGGPREHFESLEAAGLELGLRYLLSGVILRHTPALVPAGEQRSPLHLPWLDEVKLTATVGGRRWALYAVVRAWQKGWCRWLEVLRALGCLRSPTPPVQPEPAKPFRRKGPAASWSLQPKVSVLIPTLDRYPYLEKLLGQLGRQTVPPHQVIVVDQTPRERRRWDLPSRTLGLPLVWISQDRAGQCSSRNEGLRRATGEWILLVDDDVEIPDDLIERHVSTVTQFAADASSGVVRESGEAANEPEVGPPRISAVFPAGNTLLRRTWLEHSGLFDLAYDHGQRADGDLGMRFYLSGALMILNPSICILHHHAARGGLRAHGARRVTRAISKRSVWRRNLPSPWDFYLSLRYFGREAAEENALCLLASSLTCEGGVARKGFRLAVAICLLPFTWRGIQRARRQAEAMMAQFPQIPRFQSGQSASGSLPSASCHDLSPLPVVVACRQASEDSPSQ